MALRRMNKKNTGKIRSSRETQYLLCKTCKREEVEVAEDVISVVCGDCVQRMLVSPTIVEKKPIGERFPRGWHFKKRYVHNDGRIFCKGVDTGESDNVKE